MRTPCDSADRKRWGWIGIIGLACLCQGISQADDRVVFSKPTNTVDTPAGLMKERKLQQPMELITPGRPTPPSVDAPPLPSNVPSTLSNQALKEIIDRQRNWVFLTPDTAFDNPQDAETDPSEALSGQSKSSKRVLETYFENQSQVTGPSPALLDLRKEPLGFSPRMNATTDPRNDLSRPGALDLVLDRPISLGSLPSPFEKLKNLTAPSGSALSPLVYPGTTTTPSPPPDPDTAATQRSRRILTPLDQNINLLPDLTTEAIQPIVGRNPAANSGLAPHLNNPFDAAPNATRATRRYEDTLTTQILGPSTLAPAIASPLDNRLAAPAPTLLEIPKRKF